MKYLLPEEYIKLALATESSRKPYLAALHFRYLHAAMGMSTESNEILDNLKKSFFYGQEIDHVNIIEELGDMLWYMAQAIDVLRAYGHKESFSTIMEKNIAKLKTRYPDSFTESDAVNRDLDAERAVLGESLVEALEKVMEEVE